MASVGAGSLVANKRIELEQYKTYVNLVEEEPNRKTMRVGMTIVTVVAILLALFIFIMGIISGSLSKNPRNVLEKPAAAPKATTPGSQTPGQFPGQTPGQFPGQTPGQVPIEIPGQTPNLPTNPSGMAPARDKIVCDTPLLPEGAARGKLLALQPVQAQPEATAPAVNTGSIPSELLQGSSPAFSSTPSSSAPKQGKKKKALSTQTKGVGNLANLSNKVNGRGFQLYLLVLLIAVIVVLYMALRAFRKGGAKR